MSDQERDPDEEEPDEFDEWANAGRYLPSMLYPTLKPQERE